MTALPNPFLSNSALPAPRAESAASAKLPPVKGAAEPIDDNGALQPRGVPAPTNATQPVGTPNYSAGEVMLSVACESGGESRPASRAPRMNARKLEVPEMRNGQLECILEAIQSATVGVATDLSQATDCIGEIFVGARRLPQRELPADFQERLLAAIESDEIWADEKPLFLRGVK